MSAELPRWAAEIRDLFRSGSSAQFLLHGNVFDVVPAGGKLLAVPAFLEQVMFATYDVVLRYDRSRGVRATRGAEDWGDWLQNALGKEASSLTLTREPGAALDLIELVAENPHAAALHLPLPDEAEMGEYIRTLVTAQFPDLASRSDVPLDT